MSDLSVPIDVRGRTPYSIDQFVIPNGSSDYIKEILISNGEIRDRVQKLRHEIADDYKDKELFVFGVLQGAAKFMFSLFEDFPYVYNHRLIEAKSYIGTKAGPVSIGKIDANALKGKDVLIVEDIIDRGKTLDELLKKLNNFPKSIEICALLDKPDTRIVDVDVKYTGFVIPDEFVIGFGLDYNNDFRYFPHIAVLKEEVYSK
jgi:hypoxanthine phosphoribosyltransferase